MTIKTENPLKTLSTALLLLTAGTAAAQDFERIAPKAVPPPGQTDREGPRVPAADTRVRLQALKGLVFLTDPKALRLEGARDISGLDVSRVPELQTEEFRARMSRYIGKPVSAASVDRLVNDVVTYYTEQDRPFVVVTSPEQDITGGVIQLLVIEGRVGQVNVSGAQFFPESLYRDAIGLKPGESIRKRKLDADVEWLNRNPFRSATVQLAPGSAVGTTDVTLRTQERKPLRLYAGFDDTGTTLTDEKRVLFGANWGNAFGLDHQLNYQFSASPDLSTFRAHSLTYIVPLPWRHLLTVFGADSDVKGRLPAPFALAGDSTQLGLRYEVPLARMGAYSHALIGGFDWKRTNNNLEFGGTNVSATGAEVAQFSVAYTGRANDAYGSSAFTGTLFHSPGGLTDKNEDANFRSLRAFADAKYTYVNLQGQRITSLPRDFSWHLTGELQFSNENLLGSEQIGAGGFSSVRGYDEREANGDQGFLLRNELRTPTFNAGPPVQGAQAQLQLLTFLDYGVVRNKRLLPAEDRSVELASVGLGARFSVEQNVTVRFDYGWQLKDTGAPGVGPRSGRAHFALLISY